MSTAIRPKQDHEIVVHEPTPTLPAVRNDAESLMAVISRAASDPTVNIDKLERLMTMHDTIITRQAEQVFNEKMTAAQSEMRRVAADKDNRQTNSRYASYAALDRAVRPIYTAHGFNLSFDTADGAPENHVRVVCDVSNAGFSKRYKIDIPADGKGAKGGDVMTKTHATTSAVSYGRSTLVKMIFNLAIGNDDDGNAAGASAKNSGDKISAEDAQNIRDMLTAKGCPEEKFLKWAKVERIEDIGIDYYDGCVEGIKAFKKGGAK